MKTYTHIIYLFVIMLLAVAFVLKTTNCPPPIPQAEKILHWTFGKSYDSLQPLPRENTELRNFLKKVENHIANHDWEGYIQLCEPAHYEESIEFFKDEKYTEEQLPATYVHYTLIMYAAREGHISIPNHLDDPEEIGSISFVGMDDSESDDWNAIYGYIKTTKGIMKAVKIWVTDRNEKYEITAPYG